MIHKANKYLASPVHPVVVSLIGCGGTGSQILTHLARMDVSLKALDHPGLKVKVFDGDEITPANIGRQSFPAIDIGRNKAVSHVQRINRFFGLNYEAYPNFITPKTDRQQLQANIYITAVDTVPTRKLLKNLFEDAIHSQYHEFKGMYWIDTGNTRDTAQVILSTLNDETKNRLPDIFELFPDFGTTGPDTETPSCSLAEALFKQDLYINTFVAAIACDILWTLFRKGEVSYQGVFLNLETMTMKPIALRRLTLHKR